MIKVNCIKFISGFPVSFEFVHQIFSDYFLRIMLRTQQFPRRMFPRPSGARRFIYAFNLLIPEPGPTSASDSVSVLVRGSSCVEDSNTHLWNAKQSVCSLILVFHSSTIFVVAVLRFVLLHWWICTLCTDGSRPFHTLIRFVKGVAETYQYIGSFYTIDFSDFRIMYILPSCFNQ